MATGESLRFGTGMLTVLLCACSNHPAAGVGSPGAPGTLPGTAPVTINIPQDAASKTTDAFGANPLVINVGTTVTWVNSDRVPHTVTSVAAPPVWDSGTLNPGQSFSFQFTRAGNFPYACGIHPNMTGTVQVSAAPATNPVPFPTPTSATPAPPLAVPPVPSPTTPPLREISEDDGAVEFTER